MSVATTAARCSHLPHNPHRRRGSASALRRRPGRRVGPRVLPALVAGVGIRLIGSGLFVTDPAGGSPPRTVGTKSAEPGDGAGSASTPGGRLHNLGAIPIFAGIPAASLARAATAVRSRAQGWAAYSAGSSPVMAASFLRFGSAFSDNFRLAGQAGIFQRISIASGFGWLTTLSLRARHPFGSSQRGQGSHPRGNPAVPPPGPGRATPRRRSPPAGRRRPSARSGSSSASTLDPTRYAPLPDPREEVPAGGRKEAVAVSQGRQ